MAQGWQGDLVPLLHGPPVSLFQIRLLNSVVGRNPFAVSRDGSRILFPQPPEEAAEDSNVIHVMSGWQFKKP
jgi:hypothetical protein